MSNRQPSNPSFLYVVKPLLFSDLAVKASKTENKKAIQRQRRSGLEAGLLFPMLRGYKLRSENAVEWRSRLV